ncbi:MAG: hypothetical protein ABUL73_02605 [Alphaproteobacteria bacterium]
MNSFLASMTAEMGARRRRLRAAFGDRSQTLVEFLVLSGLLVGSAGLFIAPWMLPAAPWGLSLPFVFVAGFILLELRRQRAVADYKARLPDLNPDLDKQEWGKQLAELRADDRSEATIAAAEAEFKSNTASRWQARLENPQAAIAPSYDWAVLIFAFACAVAGAAAFVIAWGAKPAPPPDPHIWEPPQSAVSVDMRP